MQAKDTAAPAADADGAKIVFKDPAEAELEKKKARAARFGVPLNLSEDKKIAMRAQRCAASSFLALCCSTGEDSHAHTSASDAAFAS